MTLQNHRGSEPTLVKKIALTRAVALPVVVFGIVGAVLVGAPANAATPTGSPSSSEPSAPAAASAAPTSSPSPAPSAAPTPAAPAPSAAPVPEPGGNAGVSPAPTDLIVTSPTDGQEVHTVPGPVLVVGRAPVGAKIAVSDYQGRSLGAGTAGAAGDFSILATPASDSYDQYLIVTGTVHGRDLTEQDIEVLFDADTSLPPVVSTPATGITLTGSPVPFADPTEPFSVTVTGTAKPGDWVFVTAESTSNSDSAWGWSQVAYTDASGNWSTVVSTGAGRWSISATAQQYNADGDPLTHQSDPSAVSVILVDAPAGYVSSAVITSPAFPAAEGNLSASSTIAQPFSATATTKRFEAMEGARPTRAGADILRQSDSVHRATGSTVAHSADAGAVDVSDPSYDDYVRTDGIQVTAEPDPAMPGNVTMSLSGTGTPGQGVQLYLDTASKAFVYFEGLYPDYFQQFGLDTTGAPATTPPTDDGTITVAANGTWTTTVSIPAGPYFITAFGVNRSGSTPKLSLAGPVVPVNLTAAAVAPASVASGPAKPMLAATGLDTMIPFGTALLLLAGGAVALALSTRRRTVR